MDLDINLFLDLLNIDSTSGGERALADFIVKRCSSPGCKISTFPEHAADGEPVNVLISWGHPQIVYCTHLDTVPPYIPPTVITTDQGVTTIKGRGTCDAKGQIFAMYTACLRLAAAGESGFGLLLLFGEETGSYGAKQFRNLPGGKVVIVGEPTDNHMVKASKGTKAFEITISGKSCHSGYPHLGHSAVETFIDMMNKLRAVDFPIDPVLGHTTYNIGRLISDNPQNILSDRLTCRVYFRTTFATDTMVGDVMQTLSDNDISIIPLGGDTPMRYLTLDGFSTTTVSFGSDAPQLTNFEHRALCGPGSIQVAHTPDEHITLPEICEAVENYEKMFKQLKPLYCIDCNERNFPDVKH